MVIGSNQTSARSALKRQMTDLNLTLNFETAAAAGFAAAAGSEFNNINTLPTILTPIASLIFVLALLATLKTCIYAREIKARRSLIAAEEPERINDSPEELSQKGISDEIHKVDEANEEKGRNVFGEVCQPILSSNSLFEFSVKEAQLEGGMIITPHEKHTKVEMEVYAKEKRSSLKPCGANFDEYAVSVPRHEMFVCV